MNLFITRRYEPGVAKERRRRGGRKGKGASWDQEWEKK
jgi:hypothetical protein